MARRLSNVASKIMGRNDIVSYFVASSLRLQARMGLSVGKHLTPNKPVNNGTLFSEPCIDRIADTVGKCQIFSPRFIYYLNLNSYSLFKVVNFTFQTLNF
ncbi:hypothetical protein UlMin_001311 [Ulmus minor]